MEDGWCIMIEGILDFDCDMSGFDLFSAYTSELGWVYWA